MIKRQESDTTRGNAHGNAMVYILIAIALFGALTLTLSRQNDGADGQGISDEMAALYTNELIQYVASAQNVVDQMIFSGTDIGELNFVNPTSAGFNTGSNVHKVFHPQGGGLNYQEKFNSDIGVGTTYQWFVQNNLNIEWTETTANDVMIMAYNIKQNICEEINKKINGSATIPATTVDLEDIFDPDNATETAFDTTNCSDCEDYPSLCISNDAADTYGFYSILATQ